MKKTTAKEVIEAYKSFGLSIEGARNYFNDRTLEKWSNNDQIVVLHEENGDEPFLMDRSEYEKLSNALDKDSWEEIID